MDIGPGIQQVASFEKPFIVPDAKAFRIFLEQDVGKPVACSLDLFAGSYQGSEPIRVRGRAQSRFKLNQAKEMSNLFEKPISKLTCLQDLQYDFASKVAPAMWGVAGKQQSFGPDFLFVPTMRFQVARREFVLASECHPESW